MVESVLSEGRDVDSQVLPNKLGICEQFHAANTFRVIVPDRASRGDSSHRDSYVHLNCTVWTASRLWAHLSRVKSFADVEGPTPRDGWVAMNVGRMYIE